MRYFKRTADGQLWHTDYELFIAQWNRGLHPEWERISRAKYRDLKRAARESWNRVNNADNDGHPFKDAGR